MGGVPELPEVEALVQDLRGRLAGRAIARVAASGLHLVVHLSRAGWIRWRTEVPSSPPRPSNKNPLAARVVLDDDSGLDITEAGTQKRLALYVVRSPGEVPGIASLGPDPLSDSFTIDVLEGILRDAGRAQLKGVLRAQSVVAGIGNAYSDELLHAAKMSPFKPAASVADSPDELRTLYDAVRNVLGDAVARSSGLAAAELKGEKKSHLAVHGRTGMPCPVCGDTVREVSFADSSLQYCPTCQTGGKPLADRRLSKLLK
jgi:formamidopyrimidine-DNA glycosylase